MSIGTTLVIVAVVSVFVAFAGVLIWGDFQTRPERQKPVAYPQKRRSF